MPTSHAGTWLLNSEAATLSDSSVAFREPFFGMMKLAELKSN
jgi:hypothetical protein